MIKELRIDDRLIHGQVALKWPAALGINRIVVVNETASRNKMQEQSLKMAVPSNIKVLVKNIEDANVLFNNPQMNSVDIMVIVNTVKDALSIVEKHENLVKRVNVANVGRFDGIDKAEKLILNSNILLNHEDEKALRYLLDNTNVEIVQQIVPDNPVEKIKNFID